MAHATNVRHLPSTDDALRRRFRAHVREGREKQRRGLGYRAATAIALGAGTALGLRYGAPRLGRLAATTRSAGYDVMAKAGTQIVKGDIGGGRIMQFLRSQRSEPLFRGPRRTTLTPGTDPAREKFALGVLQYSAGAAGEKATGAAGRHYGKIGAGIGTGYFGAGTLYSRRRQRRREGQLARRLMLM